MHIGKLTMMPGDPKAHHTLLAVALIAAITLAVAVLWTAIVSLRPLPSRTVVMVTGPEGGAAQEFGRRYREVLARQGIDLRLVPTAGSLENLSRLRDPESMVEFGFLQGASPAKRNRPDWHHSARSPTNPCGSFTAVSSAARCCRPCGEEDIDRPRRERHPGAGARTAPPERDHPGFCRISPAASSCCRRKAAPQ